MAGTGCALAAPGQPGFGGTPPLVGAEYSFEGYARWTARYLDAVGAHDPVVVIGHSFGGGVALQLAHDFPERVAGVVLCNAVGGAPESGGPGGPAADRPVWQWGRHVGSDLLALSQAARVLPAVLGEAVPNLVHHPVAMWRVAGFARRADLLAQASTVAARRLPMTMVWSDRDGVVPFASFSALCRAACVRGVVVPGNHSWLIARPEQFADVAWRALVDAGVVERVLATRNAAGVAA
jgi:pimeloyl-ACP methyl ester carboxylesterase